MLSTRVISTSEMTFFNIYSITSGARIYSSLMSMMLLQSRIYGGQTKESFSLFRTTDCPGVIFMDRAFTDQDLGVTPKVLMSGRIMSFVTSGCRQDRLEVSTIGRVSLIKSHLSLRTFRESQTCQKLFFLLMMAFRGVLRRQTS